MPTATVLVAWLRDHAVVLLTVSVLVTVVGEQARAACRRQVDVAGTTTSVVAGLAYLAGKGVVTHGAFFGVALAVYDHRLFDLDVTSPWVWLALFVGRDLASYWIHRAEHRVRVLWASHLVHHSIERFTFTSAVRLPWMETLYKPVVGLWAPLLGFHPTASAAMGALVLLVGQLQHTELVRRRTVFDQVFVTPSAHRVHHGSNPAYLDRNFGSMLIVWDRLFGTYAAESEPVRYGLTGGKRVSTPADALVGGFPDLLASAGAAGGIRRGVGHLLAAP